MKIHDDYEKRRCFMSIRQGMMIIGLCVLFTGCSTGTHYDARNVRQPATNTEWGAAYLLGRGVPQNNAKAFSYFNKAAANENDPFAQNELAYLYASGKGTPRSYPKALFWYQKAANHGLASAQYSLGLMYLHGLGTPANKTVALEWFKKSAEHGFEPAKQAITKYGS
jgi:uncharacterized protein